MRGGSVGPKVWCVPAPPPNFLFGTIFLLHVKYLKSSQVDTQIALENIFPLAFETPFGRTLAKTEVDVPKCRPWIHWSLDPSFPGSSDCQ